MCENVSDVRIHRFLQRDAATCILGHVPTVFEHLVEDLGRLKLSAVFLWNSQNYRLKHPTKPLVSQDFFVGSGAVVLESILIQRVQQAARNALQVEQAFRQQDAVRTAAPGSAILDRNGRVIGTVPLQPHLPAGWRIGANGQAEQVPGFTPQTSMVPVQGYDRDGNPTLLFPDGQGGLVQARTPDGVSIAPRTREINTGTEMITVDQGGQVVSRRPIDVAGREAQQEIGRAAGQQAAGAEQAAEVAQRTLGQIDAVLNHPAIGLGTGVTGIVARRVPGTPAYDFSSRVDQLQGQAFLQAFNTLRGGGQITEVEGRKATEAIARLDPRLGEEAFRSALGELREIVQTGLARAQRHHFDRVHSKLVRESDVAGSKGSQMQSNVIKCKECINL